MKSLLVFAILLLNQPNGAFAESTISPIGEKTCSGHAWIRSVFVPFPLYRATTVKIVNNGTDNDQFSVDAGGEPFTYVGPLYLDGSKASQVTDTNNGDVAKFTTQYIQPDSLNFNLTYYDSAGHEQGSVYSTELHCEIDK